METNSLTNEHVCIRNLMCLDMGWGRGNIKMSKSQELPRGVYKLMEKEGGAQILECHVD